MKNFIKQIVSFILPVTVLILIPLYIERNFSMKHFVSFLPGLIIIIAGLSILIIAVATCIRIGKGTLAPWSPAKRLITAGLYGYVRNPMIAGVLIVLAGETVAFMSLNLLIWTLAFFVINNIFFLLYEEPGLEKRFGDEYLDYKKNVPRWIPKLKPYDSDSELNKK
jgi:protein-S-isoprenylcysteine O-methyltransferase Ste14